MDVSQRSVLGIESELIKASNKLSQILSAKNH